MDKNTERQKIEAALIQLCGSVYNAVQAHHLITGMTEEVREYIRLIYQREELARMKIGRRAP